MAMMSIEQYVDYGRIQNPGWYAQDDGASIRSFYPGYQSAYLEGESPGVDDYFSAGGLIGIGAGIGAGAIAYGAEPPYSGADPGALIQPGNGDLDWTAKYRQQFPGVNMSNGYTPTYVDDFEVVGEYTEWPMINSTQSFQESLNQFFASGGRIPGSEGFQTGYAPGVTGGSALQVAKAAALSVSVGRAGRAAISGQAIAGIIGTWGTKIAKLIFGALAVKEVTDMMGLGLGDALSSLMILWNPDKKIKEHTTRRYSFSSRSNVGTVAKSAKALKKVLRRHQKAINAFLPKPARYGIPPGRALSAIERKAIRGGK